ncbi:MAG TPA: tetratricopeptide repeat protein [Thermoanaerobaculia bacterium]|nr:tetratricopeptide repeat protein [Thermoanaerobaculia bacterium]
MRETNSHASASRGATAYAAREYAQAAKAYARAQELAPSARNAFNLGTAEIAAGQREQGSARMAEAIRDPELRADALYNRGNSALAAKALDHAIRDYTEALRANPRHAAAKRNLEIALRRRDSEQRAGSSGQQPNQQGQSPQQQQQREQPKQGNPQRQRDGHPDLDALLRSVQQQEQEELRRMKGQATEGRVGW